MNRLCDNCSKRYQVSESVAEVKESLKLEFLDKVNQCIRPDGIFDKAGAVRLGFFYGESLDQIQQATKAEVIEKIRGHKCPRHQLICACQSAILEDLSPTGGDTPQNTTYDTPHVVKTENIQHVPQDSSECDCDLGSPNKEVCPIHSQQEDSKK